MNLSLSKDSFLNSHFAGEALRVLAIGTGLAAIGTLYFPKHAALFAGGAVIEEILYRGIGHKGVELSQKGWSALKGQNLSDEDLKAQKIFRILFVSVIFALSHYESWFSTIASTAFTGIVCGTLAEETCSIALPIIYHALVNGFILASAPYLSAAVISSTVFSAGGAAAAACGAYYLSKN